ncbi:antitoxin Xre/MbcA/ParS toxin-binding domain-containing protein [Luteimonas suaedae]|uniref:antitoxin Xre/MbcA/ParS toxin-binding domain-containing protein n=1 Tax=Luteimonas suaedae TaxID=2605430 RepID=UPI0011EFC550|nr:antitoxin Xre/MbcA/ParS toxin-binding domain-containing protein [Luteimonas suaedae]
MNAVMTPQGSLAETFREPGRPYLSPHRIGEALGLQIQSLAERARVSRNTPAARPQNESLQHYLREVVRVLAAAEDAAGGDRTRAIFWFMNEPLPDFDYQTPDALVRMGKAQVVVDYIESIAGGATG